MGTWRLNLPYPPGACGIALAYDGADSTAPGTHGSDDVRWDPRKAEVGFMMWYGQFNN